MSPDPVAALSDDGRFPLPGYPQMRNSDEFVLRKYVLNQKARQAVQASGNDTDGRASPQRFPPDLLRTDGRKSPFRRRTFLIPYLFASLTYPR
jgi:hypothetical protein